MPVYGVIVPLLKAKTKAGTAVLIMGLETRVIRSQFERIREMQEHLCLGPADDLDALEPKSPLNDQQARIAVLFGDIHFLIISMSRLWRLFERVMKDMPDEPELKAISKKYRPLFEEVRFFRNKLQHIEGLVEAEVGALGDARSAAFGLDGKTFHYGTEVESKVQSFYEAVRDTHLAIARRKGLKPFERVSGQMRV